MKLFLSVLMGFLLFIPSNSEAAEQDNQNYLIETNAISQLQNDYHFDIKEKIDGQPIYQVILNTPEEIQAIKEDERTNSLIENEKVSFLQDTTETPSTPLEFSSILHNSMKFPDNTFGTREITIAVIDTGIDFNHPSLTDYIIPGFNVYNQSALPQDDQGHGTHVAGIIALDAPKTLKIMPIKVLDQYGDGDIFSIVQGIYYGIDHGAKVLNLSFGAPFDNTAIKDAIAAAVNKEITVVAATGNKGGTPVYYPAKYDNVLGIGAIDGKDQVPSFSQYGEDVDFVAPGVNIMSTYIGGGFKALSGTSMSTAFVTRAAGYLYNENAFITNSNLETMLKSASVDLGAPGKDIYTGYGKINVQKAITTSFDSDQNEVIDLYDEVSLSKTGKYDQTVNNYYGKLVEK